MTRQSNAMASSIVDDRDPRFAYTSGWFLRSGVESEFDSTSHGSIVSGSTAVLTFNGRILRLA
jgi:hypothetical protein